MCSDALFEHARWQSRYAAPADESPTSGHGNARMNSRTKVSFRINTIRALAPAEYRQEDIAFQRRYLSGAAIPKNLSAGSLANSDKAASSVSGGEGCSARSVVVVVVRLVSATGRWAARTQSVNNPIIMGTYSFCPGRE